MKNYFRLGLIAFACFAGNAAATVQPVVVTYIFDDGINGGGTTLINSGATGGSALPGGGVSALDPNLDASAWTDTAGTLQGLLGFGSPNRGEAIAAADWNGTNSNSFNFSLTVHSGYRLDLSGFAFDEQSSNGSKGAGPTSWTLFVNNAQVATGAGTLGTEGSHSGALSLAGLTGPVNVQMFASGATAASATWRVDNFAFQGAVAPVPLPPALVLLLSGLGCAGWLGSRAGRCRR